MAFFASLTPIQMVLFLQYRLIDLMMVAVALWFLKNDISHQ
jgi:hypothetical protein